MASVQIEIQSFVDKFAHLSSLGYNNNLHFNSYNDVVFVNFQAELGVVNAEPRLLTCVLTRPVKPSKVRRSARRDELGMKMIRRRILVLWITMFILLSRHQV